MLCKNVSFKISCADDKPTKAAIRFLQPPDAEKGQFLMNQNALRPLEILVRGGQRTRLQHIMERLRDVLLSVSASK
jgi:hypothetical protein